ncbi:MAG TPA: hypothetical protein VGZ25_09740 [Gemmataceae bacterium]|jgi:hypothetical protein|nr:hypothetical protein [Gemmataceae bacterium]
MRIDTSFAMVVLRRFLVIMALLFWQGGFLFYSSVVVPIGQRVLASPKDQGFITQQVTDYMNLAGAIALAILLADLFLSPDPHAWVSWIRRFSWLVMFLALLAIAWWHVQLDDLLDFENKDVLDRKAFQTGHRWYLWLCTVQWFFGLVYLWLTLWSWRALDQREYKRGLQN